MLKDFIQGKPLRHPLHPLLVHFPLALFVFSFVLDLASLAFANEPALVRGSYYLIGGGIVFAMVAAVAGFTDYLDIRSDHPARRIAAMHMFLNLAAVGFYGINFGLRSTGLAENEIPALGWILSALSLVLLSISGYLGGQLVYDHGIGVGRHRRRTATPDKTLQITATDGQPSSDGKIIFVPVAPASALDEKATLRVDVDGQLICILKLEGALYGIQEFCTHRFGPLSEGCVRDGQIECPWHRSRFDVRTGQVVHGPAKERLKVFRVEIREDRIWLALEPKVTDAADFSGSDATQRAA
ncbi:MAG: DUF2231 domain-containing protein [Verrucomicrobiota bacterium]|jgi:uncharacterized membrane protein/nitrite reductase/ring-hydroxylating ferredoxin subunit